MVKEKTDEDKKKKKSNKYVFTLKDIDIEKIDEKYGINFIPRKNDDKNITKLSNIEELEKQNEVVTFYDETKKECNCFVSMIDFTTKKKLENYNCFWCKHQFMSKPIGCPIKYIPNKVTKKYHSELTKDIYTIREDITKSRSNWIRNKNVPFSFTLINTNKEKDIKNTDTTFELDQRGYYETDGIFCSFNCVKSYIKDNKHNILYSQSDILLLKLYNDITNSKIAYINPAPHWRLLKSYGGHLTIDKFRENFIKVNYEFHGIFRPYSYLYEEKFNFN